LDGAETEHHRQRHFCVRGAPSEALPPLLRGRVRADFRDEAAYFTTAFDLIVGLYQLPPNHTAVADPRDSLREPNASGGGLRPEMPS
jgi:hypothetical protein